jgi:hypothetical protein
VLVSQIHVECLNCGPDSLDYVAAFGGVGSAVLAVVAIVLAVRAGKDARRSADAAERTAAAASASTRLAEESTAHAREQLEIERARAAALAAEQNRRPKVEPSIEILVQDWSAADTPFVVVQIGAINRGDKTASDAHAILFMPAAISVHRCDEKGENRFAAQTVTQTGHQLKAAFDGRVSHDVHSVDWALTLKQGGTRQVTWYRLGLPAAGEYTLAFRVLHEDLQDGAETATHVLTIPPREDSL